MPRSTLETFPWIPRPHTERRLHLRVRLAYPMELQLDADRPPLPATGLDLSLGGARLKLDRYVELFTRGHVRFALPSTERDGTMTLSAVEAPVAIVRVDPDEESDEVESYELALQFSRLEPADERIIAMALLQRMLFDPDARIA